MRPNDEILMTNDERNPNHEIRNSDRLAPLGLHLAGRVPDSSFDIQASFVTRHSSFGFFNVCTPSKLRSWLSVPGLGVTRRRFTRRTCARRSLWSSAISGWAAFASIADVFRPRRSFTPLTQLPPRVNRSIA